MASSRRGPAATQLDGLADLALPVAALGVVAWVLSRGVSTALRGASVGIGGLIEATDLVGRFASYGFAIVGSALALAATAALARAPILSAVRFGAIPLVGMVVWAVTAAALTRLPVLALFFAGFAAISLTTSLAISTWSRSVDRAGQLGLVVALGASLVGSVRLTAAWLGTTAADFVDAEGYATARKFADLGLVLLLLLAVGAYAALEASRVVPRAAPRPLVRWPTVGVAVVAVLLVRAALAADGEDPSPLAVLCRRTLDLLGSRPTPTRGFLRLAAHAAALVVPIAALFELRVRRSVRAAVALLLAGSSSPDRPLGALLLSLGACSSALAALDKDGVWTHLSRVGRGRLKRGAQPPGAPAA